jgi:hypothetical protein
LDRRVTGIRERPSPAGNLRPAGRICLEQVQTLNQFGLTFALFTHYGVTLWVPEVGGPLDSDNEAHDLVTSVFGGMSKGERNRIKVRVRTARRTEAGRLRGAVA